MSLLFSILANFLLRHNYVFYLFDVITFFDEVRITLYFDMFELRMEIKLQLHFVLVVIFKYFLLRPNYVIYLFVVVTFLDDVRIKLCTLNYVRLNYVLRLRYKMVIF